MGRGGNAEGGLDGEGGFLRKLGLGAPKSDLVEWPGRGGVGRSGRVPEAPDSQTVLLPIFQSPDLSLPEVEILHPRRMYLSANETTKAYSGELVYMC